MCPCKSANNSSAKLLLTPWIVQTFINKMVAANLVHFAPSYKSCKASCKISTSKLQGPTGVVCSPVSPRGSSSKIAWSTSSSSPPLDLVLQSSWMLSATVKASATVSCNRSSIASDPPKSQNIFSNMFVVSTSASTCTSWLPVEFQNSDSHSSSDASLLPGPRHTRNLESLPYCSKCS